MKKRLVFTLLAGIFAVTNAMAASMPPKCDSREVKSTLKEIINEQLGIPLSNFNITNQRTLDANKKTLEYTCYARVIFTEDGYSESEAIEYSVFWNNIRTGEFYVQIE